jgi:hypothetical protein
MPIRAKIIVLCRSRSFPIRQAVKYAGTAILASCEPTKKKSLKRSFFTTVHPSAAYPSSQPNHHRLQVPVIAVLGQIFPKRQLLSRLHETRLPISLLTVAIVRAWDCDS